MDHSDSAHAAGHKPRERQRSSVIFRIYGSIFNVPMDLHASAATVSAQVSTLVRIASSEYEVMDTLCRPKVT